MGKCFITSHACQPLCFDTCTQLPYLQAASLTTALFPVLISRPDPLSPWVRDLPRRPRTECDVEQHVLHVRPPCGVAVVNQVESLDHTLMQDPRASKILHLREHVVLTPPSEFKGLPYLLHHSELLRLRESTQSSGSMLHGSWQYQKGFQQHVGVPRRQRHHARLQKPPSRSARPVASWLRNGLQIRHGQLLVWY